jgi:Tol biopolymer transport system component
MMKSIIAIISIALMASGFSLSATQGQSDSSEGTIRRNANAIPEHYIVRLKDEVTSGEVEQTASRLVSSRDGSIIHFFQFAIKGFSAVMSEADAAALSKNPLVAYVEEDAIITDDSAGQKLQSNSASFSAQSIQPNPPWGLDRIDQRDLPLDNSYSYTNTGAGVNVYVISTGIRFSHQEFGARALLGIDTVGDGQSGNDCNGLGTAVAATIGGATYGVAKSATLYSVRAFTCSNGTTVANLVAAIDWVTGNHVSPAVAHMSISTAANATIDAAVSNSIASGVTYALAAGDINVDAGTRSPSRVAAAMTVGGTTTIDSRVTTSNFGASLDLFAPGQDIVTASHFSDSASTTRNGTAMAAAHVAGEAARYLQSNPTDTPAAVSQAITSNTTTGKVLNPGTGSPNRLLYRPNGKIAFVSSRDGNSEIYSMNVDGTNQTRLTNSTSYDSNPVWSPDGSKIAFVSDRTGNSEIFVMNADGSNQINLTNNAGGDYEPAWSPDGTKIAFVSDRVGNEPVSSPDGTKSAYARVRVDNYLFVMNSNGSNQVNLTDIDAGIQQAPSWSPDGTTIAFSRTVPNGVIDIGDSASFAPEYFNSEIYLIYSDGSDRWRLTYSDDADDYLPVWSPNGAKIAFQTSSTTNAVRTDSKICVINVDGTDITMLTTSMSDPVYAYFSGWSPDSTRVAFHDGQGEVYTVNVDNTNLTRLTNNTVNDSDAIFLPDGARLLFTTSRNGSTEIYVMNADGSNQTNLTNNLAADSDQALQPM